MKRYNKNLGDFGEDITCEYLLEKGYKILARNFRFGRNEIDIIAENEKLIAFVEVKTRKNVVFGMPSEAVDKSKVEKIISVAQSWLENNPTEKEIRIDVSEVIATIVDGNPCFENINYIAGIVLD